MKKLLNIVATSLCLVAVSAHGASVTLGTAGGSGVTASINPDATETGTVNVYMAAVYNGMVFFRGPATSAWTPYTSGSFPVATTVALGGAAKTVTVVDFDIASLPGLILYVAYGASQTDLTLSGHLGAIYTVPALPVAATPSETAPRTILDSFKKTQCKFLAGNNYQNCGPGTTTDFKLTVGSCTVTSVSGVLTATSGSTTISATLNSETLDTVTYVDYASMGLPAGAKSLVVAAVNGDATQQVRVGITYNGYTTTASLDALAPGVPTIHCSY